MYRKVAEALESMEAQELTREVMELIRATYGDGELHVGVLLLDCYLVEVYTEEGRQKLRELILAPEEEADYSRAEIGSREFKQRALVYVAKRFAQALAEKLGIADAGEDTRGGSVPAKNDTGTPGIRHEHECISTEDTLTRKVCVPGKPREHVEDAPEPASQLDAGDGVLFGEDTLRRPQYISREEGISTGDTQVGGESTAEDTAPPHPPSGEDWQVLGEDTSSVPSVAMLISRIEQLQGLLEEQERYASDLERRLREQEQAAARAISEKDAEIRSLKQQVELYAQRIKNLERLNRRLAAQMDALLTGKKGEKVANAVRVLLTIKSMGGEAQVSQLCEAIGWKRAQVWRYLRALRESGFVVESRGKYRTTNQVNRAESERELREMLVLRWADTGHLNRPLSEPRSSRQ